MADNLPQESSIRVTVRVRPFNSTELELFQNGCSIPRPAYASAVTANQTIKKIVHVLDDSVVVFDPPPTNDDAAVGMNRYRKALRDNANAPVQTYRRYKDVRYAFDRVFNEDTSQDDVYEGTTKHLIEGILNGYNATVFAYGATGCGKTHTISGTVDDPGIIFLTVRELFDRIEATQEDKTVQFSLSYLEVYNEMIRDLLVDKDKVSKQLAIREDINNRIVVAGLSEHNPKSVTEVMDLILHGNANRTISPTEANAVSSRSHAVLQINVRQRPRTADIQTDYTLATLSLIDLAGSERAAATKNRGDRMLEGANINRSLLALGNCINALCDASKKEQHIPYRDSKLTRLLKFSLGGNCKTVMIVCVSPSSLHYEETHNTLKYANRAKNIKTKVQRNFLSVDRHVTQYVQAIHQLRQEIAELKSKINDMEENGYRTKDTQGKRAASTKLAEETIRKMRISYEIVATRDVEVAQAQARMTMIQMKLESLRGWQDSFTENVAKIVDERMRQQTHGYGNMVEDLMRELEAQAHAILEKMEDAKKAAGSRRIDIGGASKDDELVKKEKELLELRNENARLRIEKDVQAKMLEEQWDLTKGFLRLNGACLAGLRSTIAEVEAFHNDVMDEGTEGQGRDYLNNLYMQNITLFTDSTKRSMSTFNDSMSSGASSLLLGNVMNEYSVSESRGIASFGRNAPSSARPSRVIKDTYLDPSNTGNSRPKRRMSMMPATTVKPSNVSNPPRRRSLYQPNPPVRSSNIDVNVTSPSSRSFRIRTPRKTIILVSRLTRPTKASIMRNAKEEMDGRTSDETDRIGTPSVSTMANVPKKRIIADAVGPLGVSRSTMALRSRIGSDNGVDETYDNDGRNSDPEDRPTRSKKSRRAVTFADEPLIFGEATDRSANVGAQIGTRKGGLKKGKDDISLSTSSLTEEITPAFLPSPEKSLQLPSLTPPKEPWATSSTSPYASRDRSDASTVGPMRISVERRKSRRLSSIPASPPPLSGNQRFLRHGKSAETGKDESFSLHNTSSSSLSEELLREKERSPRITARPRRQTMGAEEMMIRSSKSFGNWDGLKSFGLGPATRSKKLDGSGLKIAKVPDLVGGLLSENFAGRSNIAINGLTADTKENTKPKWK